MRLIGRRKSSKAKKGSSAPAPLQSKEKVAANAEGVVVAAGSNSRQVAPDDSLPLGAAAAGYASSRDEVFYEACPWLESDCEDEFFSINGASADGTPARSFRANSGSHTAPPPEPRKLPTLGAILMAEPLTPPPPTRLADLLRERQESFAHDGAGVGVISRNGSYTTSSCGGAGGSSYYYCCMPSLPRAAVGVRYAGRRKRR
ncbi:uncharacterized protein LOC102714335 [Oryza brachyantha]|uniref:Uncharacterized protein n=1 Tax=Oryza brachyantha TaxID=4533 RepID=J3ND64_ORYBR|nr:uncharacterized protein LOC102714335 [Oryza brachyantha]XP_015698457.1 uncharacterized protein LOC102714335 [Oryza brachyantha]XP_040385847.1 uncharacterized protein LOC102714335 [Oryza brachyantha]